MRVLCWGTYDTGKPRTRILRRGLRLAGLEVEECHASVWQGIEDKSQVRGFTRRVLLLLRWIGSYPRMVWRFMRAPRPDLVLIGFPGVLDALVLAPFARLRRVPVAWDMFMSLYDTVVLDRRMLASNGLMARLLRATERAALRCCDLVFLDTEAHARRVEELFGLPPRRCGAVWVGVETEHFTSSRPSAALRREPAAPLQVLFYGQFIALHGLETIVEAAREMCAEPVEWTLIGHGQESSKIDRMLREAPLTRLRRIDWVSYEELRDCIERADLCLGIFGNSGKAASVIPNKVFQIVAAGRPVITRDSAAIRELLAHAPPCSYLIPPADPKALASAIRAHREYLVSSGASACHSPLMAGIDAAAVGRQFRELVRSRLARAM
jgi:glycosyltransferase involved in cell wall biosynthesis